MFRSKSRVVRGSLAPEWNETYYCTIPHGELTLYLRVLDYDLVVPRWYEVVLEASGVSVQISAGLFGI